MDGNREMLWLMTVAAIATLVVNLIVGADYWDAIVSAVVSAAMIAFYFLLIR